MTETAEGSWLSFGTLGRPHGLLGEVRFFAHHRESENRRRLDTIRLVLEDRVFDTRVTRVRLGGKHDILVIEGIGDRDEAASWTHAELLVPADWLPPLEEGEFYAYELEGLEARDADGQRIGEVLTLTSFGAGDILVVRVGGQEVLIPFSEPTVTEVDLGEGFVTVDITDFK